MFMLTNYPPPNGGMNYGGENLDSDEARKKAETLFSKKFIDYLSNKKSSVGNAPEEASLPPKDGGLSSSDDTSASESSRKSGKKLRKKLKEKQSYKSLDFNYAVRNKLTQCNQLKNAEEMAPPEELKSLLVNLTIFLQDLKQFPTENENLYNLISRITILVTEFIRRPIKKIQDKKETSKNLDKTIEAIISLLEEYKDGSAVDSENGIREYKRIEKEIASKEQEIAETKEKLSEPKEPAKARDIDARVKESILNNEKLKSDIKFNQNHIKKYKKILLEKEWMKHKVESELTHLKKKVSKVDLYDGESFDRNLKQAEGGLTNENAHKGTISNKVKTGKSQKEKEKTKSGVKLK